MVIFSCSSISDFSHVLCSRQREGLESAHRPNGGREERRGQEVPWGGARRAIKKMPGRTSNANKKLSNTCKVYLVTRARRTVRGRARTAARSRFDKLEMAGTYQNEEQQNQDF